MRSLAEIRRCKHRSRSGEIAVPSAQGDKLPLQMAALGHFLSLATGGFPASQRHVLDARGDKKAVTRSWHTDEPRQLLRKPPARDHTYAGVCVCKPGLG